MKLSPFLLFNGTCAEAMTFYQSCLGGELMLIRLGDTPMAQQMPPEQHGKITYAHLVNGALEISGSDWLHPIQQPQAGNMTGIYLTDGTMAELKPVFDRLREGTDTTYMIDLQQIPFGIYGHLTDRFGVPWFFQGSM